jgi:hypothetical protein
MHRTVRISRTRSSGTVTTSLLILPLALAISTGPDRVNAQSRGDRAHPLADAALLQQTQNMKLNIRIEDSVFTGTLNNSKAAQDFAALLPLSLTLEDYASTEKISDLPKRLTTDGAPSGFDPSAGDIAYYAPWRNLAIFYKDFRYSSGLVSLGTLVSGLKRLARSGPVHVTIELAHRR